MENGMTFDWDPQVDRWARIAAGVLLAAFLVPALVPTYGSHVNVVWFWDMLDEDLAVTISVLAPALLGGAALAAMGVAHFSGPAQPRWFPSPIRGTWVRFGAFPDGSRARTRSSRQVRPGSGINPALGGRNCTSAPAGTWADVDSEERPAQPVGTGENHGGGHPSAGKSTAPKPWRRRSIAPR